MGTVVDNTVTGRKVNRLRLKKRDSTDGHEITPRLERFNHDSQEEMKDFFLLNLTFHMNFTQGMSGFNDSRPIGPSLADSKLRYMRR